MSVFRKKWGPEGAMSRLNDEWTEWEKMLSREQRRALRNCRRGREQEFQLLQQKLGTLWHDMLRIRAQAQALRAALTAPNKDGALQ